MKDFFQAVAGVFMGVLIVYVMMSLQLMGSLTW